MYASRHENGIHISPMLSASLNGLKSGYRVDMHDPIIRVPIFVDALSADDAHRMAINLCTREAVGFRLTGATIQRF
jgi:hypothetical protein